jgi:hypothetical protein
MNEPGHNAGRVGLTYTGTLKSHARRLEDNPVPCGRGAVLGVSRTLRRAVLVPLRCKQWTCPHCGPKLLNRWRNIIADGKPERHIVLTCDPKRFASPAHAIMAMNRAWTRLLEMLRDPKNGFPIRMEYVRVWELQEKGWPHMHIAQRGPYIPFAWLRYWWNALGIGTHVHIKEIPNPLAIAREVVKYITKRTAALHYTLPGSRIVNKSNRWLTPEQAALYHPPPGTYEWSYTELDLAGLMRALDQGGALALGENTRTQALEIDLSRFQYPSDGPYWLPLNQNLIGIAQDVLTEHLACSVTGTTHADRPVFRQEAVWGTERPSRDALSVDHHAIR